MKMDVAVVEAKNNMPNSHNRKLSPQTNPVSNGRRFSEAGEAATEIIEGFDAWSASVGVYGMHMAYAVIAANWAVYGNEQAILSNNWAKGSLAIVIIFLGLNLLCTWIMTNHYSKRCEYANKDKARWINEFEKENTQSSPWPYTKSIEELGDFIRFIKVVMPIAGGLVLIIGLLYGGSVS